MLRLNEEEEEVKTGSERRSWWFLGSFGEGGGQVFGFEGFFAQLLWGRIGGRQKKGSCWKNDSLIVPIYFTLTWKGLVAR